MVRETTTWKRLSSSALAAVVLVALFLCPALYNRDPFLFPDSVGYFQAGTAALSSFVPHAKTTEAVAPSHGAKPTTTSRSVYYGIPIVEAYRMAGAWAIAVVQSLLAVVVLFAGLRWFRGGDLSWRDVVVVAVAGLVGGLAIFTDAWMPDLLAGLMILAAAVFLAFHDRMTATERLAWLILILAAMLAHKGHVAVMAVILVLAAGVAALHRRFRWRPIAGLTAALIIAVVGHRAVDLVVERVSGSPPVPTPFLLSRVVGDGTALPYLVERCPTHPFVICRFLGRFPMTENEFLWHRDPQGGVVENLTIAERRRLSAESNEIIIGSILRDPPAQIKATVWNIAREAATVGVTEFGERSGIEPWRSPGMADTLAHYRSSAAFERRMPLWAISRMMLAVYFIGIVGLLVLAVRRSKTVLGSGDTAVALQLVVLGVAANAAVFGAVSSVSDRYQGRVAWLLPFMLLTMVWRPVARAERPAAVS